MRVHCVRCEKDSVENGARPKIVSHGSYYRSSDGQRISRYRCTKCLKSFSSATFAACYWQKKRHKNNIIEKILASTGSMRRTAKILSLHRITIVRKANFLGIKAKSKLCAFNKRKPRAREIEFDDLETFEHTKCKPISVTLVVETKTRRILDFEVSRMPAKGLLVEKAKKYGYRPDERRRARRKLFERIQSLVEEDCIIKSDCNPHYEKVVREFFPKASYVQHLGKRGANTGQGELKKVKYDPLFSLNHTCAMFRANVNRLIRKTWCTTKKMERLKDHLYIYANYHNRELIKN